MASVREDTATQISSEVAETHVRRYYQALETSRSTIASFYVAQSFMPDGKALPAIVFNGNVVDTALTFQNMFEDEMPQTHYDIQCYDCQAINLNYVPTGSVQTDDLKGHNMTLLIVVSGAVKLGPLREVAARGFSESFVLVPNPDAEAAKARKKPVKDWLIQSQTFRIVV